MTLKAGVRAAAIQENGQTLRHTEALQGKREKIKLDQKFKSAQFRPVQRMNQMQL